MSIKTNFTVGLSAVALVGVLGMQSAHAAVIVFNPQAISMVCSGGVTKRDINLFRDLLRDGDWAPLEKYANYPDKVLRKMLKNMCTSWNGHHNAKKANAALFR
jgi:hypothetical protein